MVFYPNSSWLNHHLARLGPQAEQEFKREQISTAYAQIRQFQGTLNSHKTSPN
ncbi:MAG: hypothetical protein ACRYFU_21305 [Janthinobacterium lividum]